MKQTASLWHHTHFRRLWTAYTLSRFGTGITWLALPILAAVLLEASAVEMGILSAAGTLPYLLLGLPAGVIVDRVRKRPFLIAADIGRAVLLTAVPLLFWLGWLRIEWLYLITFLGGVLTLFFDVSEEAFLPAVIQRKRLTEGYSKLSASESMIELSGPVVASGLISLLTAPVAILIDAFTFVGSAGLIRSINVTEPTPKPASERPNFLAEIREGLQFIFQSPLLRPMVATGATMQIFGGMIDALLILYLVNTLGLPATFIGVIYAVGSLTGLLAASRAERINASIGLGRMVLLGSLCIGIGSLGRPLAGGPAWMAMGILLTGQAVAGFGNTVFNISASTLRQTITPDGLLGRINATDRFLSWGMLPVGALIGGWLGQSIGLREALIVSSSGLFWAFLWVFFSPLRDRVMTQQIEQIAALEDE